MRPDEGNLKLSKKHLKSPLKIRENLGFFASQNLFIFFFGSFGTTISGDKIRFQRLRTV